MRTQRSYRQALPCRRSQDRAPRKGPCRSISGGRNDPRAVRFLFSEGMTTEIEILQTPFNMYADQQSVITGIAESARPTKERLEYYLLRNRSTNTDWPDVCEDERHMAIVLAEWIYAYAR
jgi:hypothetical protein